MKEASPLSLNRQTTSPLWTHLCKMMPLMLISLKQVLMERPNHFFNQRSARAHEMFITCQMREEIQTAFLPQEESCRSPRACLPGLWFADLEYGAKGIWWEMQIKRRMVTLPQILTLRSQQNQKTANARHCSYFFTYYSPLQKVPNHAYKLMCILLHPLEVSMF